MKHRLNSPPSGDFNPLFLSKFHMQPVSPRIRWTLWTDRFMYPIHTVPTAMTQRNRPRKQLTFSQDLYDYLSQNHLNASGLVSNILRENISPEAIEQAHLQAKKERQQEKTDK